jgi:hypothetical protein
MEMWGQPHPFRGVRIVKGDTPSPWCRRVAFRSITGLLPGQQPGRSLEIDFPGPLCSKIPLSLLLFGQTTQLGRAYPFAILYRL